MPSRPILKILQIMADTNNYKEFQKLSFKDIQSLMLVSEATAKKYLTDIKTHFCITIVTYSHFKQYIKA
ncbi:hypothetical protein SAMN05192550_2807 [Flavobacterium glycines]|uniref:Uncharacterized protein n=1 Tax=Flavobacterium glycines TaxID=551990 RepID=A0A511CGS3_9FLAO|nr:hypothetical protein FGL01_25560 [Flavobacterium glycines]SDJ80557.1 hypothetical protein SAMN05192550_2807 [Flavobacterium glycines]